VRSTADRALFNPLRRRGRVALATTFLVALLRIAPAGAAEEQDPLAVDEYAKRFEVGKDLAAERLDTQAQGAAVVSGLEARLGTDYAGVWFDNSTGQFVVPVVDDGDREAVAKQFDQYGLGESRYRIEPVQSTVADLEATQMRIGESIKDLFEQGRARTGIDPHINGVVVEVASPSAEDLAGLRAQGAAEPARVKIVVSDAKEFGDEPAACTWNSELRSCDPPFHGGVEIHGPTTCTSGFAATGNSFGNKFVLSAGHCLSHLGLWWAETANGFENSLGYEAGYYYGNEEADGGLIQVENSNWWVEKWGWRGHVVIWGPPANPAAIQNPSNPISGSQSSYVGEYVCHSGRTWGSSCGTVQQVNAKTSYEGGKVALSHMTRVEGDCGTEGDSGGPVWAGNYALGIWSGGQLGACTVHFYTEVKEIESRYAVHVTPW
jgi:hypothetical protein